MKNILLFLRFFFFFSRRRYVSVRLSVCVWMQFIFPFLLIYFSNVKINVKKSNSNHIHINLAQILVHKLALAILPNYSYLYMLQSMLRSAYTMYTYHNIASWQATPIFIYILYNNFNKKKQIPSPSSLPPLHTQTHIHTHLRPTSVVRIFSTISAIFFFLCSCDKKGKSKFYKQFS